MSRFLFRTAAFVEPVEIEEAWAKSTARRVDQMWFNTTGHQAILSACLLGDDPCAWWHEPGGGCVYIVGEDERAGFECFFDIYRGLFDRVEFDLGG